MPKLIIAVLNWKEYKATAECLNSLSRASLPSNTEIHLLQNEVNRQKLNQLSTSLHLNYKLRITNYRKNLGYSGAYNAFCELIIPKLKPTDIIIFLNNDTEVTKNFAQKMIEKVDFETKTEMIACTMLLMEDKTSIDNRGVTMYRSGIAHPRSLSSHRLFCPSGGCALYTVNLLKTLKEKTGYYLDHHFFCYTEDVDLGYRALLLGFKPDMAQDAIIYHHLSLSSGGTFNEFIMYYGLRNTLLSITKNTPLSLLIIYSPYIIGLQLAIIFRYSLQLKFRITFNIYYHYLKALPRLIKQRKLIQKAKVISNKELKKYITPKLYEWNYLKLSLKTIFQRDFVKRVHRPLNQTDMPSSSHTEASNENTHTTKNSTVSAINK